MHMGTDAVLNQRAVDSVVFHCARESRLVALSPGKRPCARRGAQGAAYPGLTRTANDVHHGVGPSVSSRGFPPWRRLLERASATDPFASRTVYRSG